MREDRGPIAAEVVVTECGETPLGHFATGLDFLLREVFVTPDGRRWMKGDHSRTASAVVEVQTVSGHYYMEEVVQLREECPGEELL